MHQPGCTNPRDRLSHLRQDKCLTYAEGRGFEADFDGLCQGIRTPPFPQPDLFHSTSVKSSVALSAGFVPLSTCDRQAFGATL